MTLTLKVITYQQFFLESAELNCDPTELGELFQACVQTCLTNPDKTLLNGCVSKCQASQAENQAKCDSQKGKIFHNNTLYLELVQPIVKNVILLLNVFRLKVVVSATVEKVTMEMVKIATISTSVTLDWTICVTKMHIIM